MIDKPLCFCECWFSNIVFKLCERNNFILLYCVKFNHAQFFWGDPIGPIWGTKWLSKIRHPWGDPEWVPCAGWHCGTLEKGPSSRTHRDPFWIPYAGWHCGTLEKGPSSEPMGTHSGSLFLGDILEPYFRGPYPGPIGGHFGPLYYGWYFGTHWLSLWDPSWKPFIG